VKRLKSVPPVDGVALPPGGVETAGDSNHPIQIQTAGDKQPTPIQIQTMVGLEACPDCLADNKQTQAVYLTDKGSIKGEG